MSLFDLLFIAAFLTTLATLLFAALSAIRGQRARAAAILRKWVFATCVYFGIVVLVSLLSPRRVLRLGDSRCFDDWCIAIESVKRRPSQAYTSYVATIKLSSRAQAVSQRENNLALYLTDNHGRRYDPLPDKSSVPLNTLLGPQQSVETTRNFELPPNPQDVGIVIAHEGGFPIGRFIIGEESWFRKPAIVPLASEENTPVRP